jgi:hypothetical protein
MRRFLKTVSIIASFLLLTSFSCSKKKTIGEPYILYEIHGTVYGSYYKEKEGAGKELVTSPIKDIKVISDSSSEVAYTSDAGRFVVYGRSVPTQTVSIAFEDTDGDNNHGTFLRTTKHVTLRKMKDGADRNYEGYWIASGVEVTMLRKTDSMESDPDLDKFQ